MADEETVPLTGGFVCHLSVAPEPLRVVVTEYADPLSAQYGVAALPRVVGDEAPNEEKLSVGGDGAPPPNIE